MTSIFWHRRDLRIHDNAGLFRALSSSKFVQPVFIFDTTILSKLSKNDQRILFIYQEIKNLKEKYNAFGGDLKVYYGDPILLIPEIIKEFNASSLFTNRDYEPYALKRDRLLFDHLKQSNIDFIGTKDHVIFEKNEILKSDGTPYLVFTPYSRKWKETFTKQHLENFNVEKNLTNLRCCESSRILSLKEMGFDDQQTVNFPPKEFPVDIIQNYSKKRDYPGIDGTSRLSVHLRFGTISIRELAKSANTLSETYLNELIWRDFYQMIIFHFPHSAENSFRKQYDRIQWEYNEDHFHAWCEGNTGYPIVDAGMRQLNSTGFMHNRVRMIVASFLTKHLLIDWRIGEVYFAEKLMDYELASNVGGWQWAAGCGCDAAPYFRVFNPISQQEKFDKNFNYIKKWVPEFGTNDYPLPIIDHKYARERVLQRYKQALIEK